MSTATSDDLKLKLIRVFDAPRALVFQACTQKEHIKCWMCPNGFTIPSSDGDLRPGGLWHSLMIAADGERFPMSGVYEEIVPDELLVFTHAWEGDDGKPEHWTKVTMRFEDAGAGKTKLTFEQSIFKSSESRDNHVDGWTQCLDKLTELLAKLQAKA